MPDKLTDLEIVKALECCATNGASCKDCPAFVKVDRSNCKKYFRGALDLINRQKEDLAKKDKELLEALKYSAVYKTKVIDSEKEINRLQAENKKFKDRQKPTGASGYKIENGKVVFFTNMLGGCEIVKENLEEVVKTLNELLQEAYAKDEIAFALKCKTEELETAKAENEMLREKNGSIESEIITLNSLIEIKNNTIDIQFKTIEKYESLFKTAKAEAYKEFAERLKENVCEDYEIYEKCSKNMRSFDYQKGYADYNNRLVWYIDNLLKELEGEDK